MDTSKLYCPNPDCVGHTKVGSVRRFGSYGKRGTQRFRCKICKETFSARRFTA